MSWYALRWWEVRQQSKIVEGSKWKMDFDLTEYSATIISVRVKNFDVMIYVFLVGWVSLQAYKATQHKLGLKLLRENEFESEKDKLYSRYY